MNELNDIIKTQEPAIKTMMMPKDTNGHGTIFGGVILSYIDQAGAIAAYQQFNQKFVTITIEKVTFEKPVFVNDLVSFYATISKTGRTSITTQILVVVNRANQPEPILVTRAQATYVAIDNQGRPEPLKSRVC